MAQHDLPAQPVQQLLDAMASGRPDPAAGSAAALTAALAAALVGKAARLSRRHLDTADRLAEESDALRVRAVELAEADAAVVAAMGAAARSASQDQPQREGAGHSRSLGAKGRDTRPASARRSGAALADAIAVPREIAALAAEVGQLATLVGEYGNPRLRADAHAAQHLSGAAAATAETIVRSNEGLLD